MATVANTAANINGDTLLTAENSDTVTGLKTFDRDPAAPFAVSASSAVVPNLDADKVDGLHALGWTAFTPTWTNVTVGNGTNVGSYMKIGDMTFVAARLLFGTTTAITGAVQLTIPVNADTTFSSLINGFCYMLDNGTAVFVGAIVLNSSTTMAFFALDDPSLVSIGANVNTTVPFVWTTGDALNIWFSYKSV